MKWLINPTTTTNVFIVIFFVLWGYTEIAELLERNKFQEQFKHFHDEGARFTADDGAVMRDEMKLIQQQVDLLIQVESIEHPELRDD
jgi:hypothetical protein